SARATPPTPQPLPTPAPHRAHLDLPLRFFFNDTATTEIYSLSLHDALPILVRRPHDRRVPRDRAALGRRSESADRESTRLNSSQYLVCRLLLEKSPNYT